MEVVWNLESLHSEAFAFGFFRYILWDVHEVTVFADFLFVQESRERNGQIVRLRQQLVVEATLKLVVVIDELVPLLLEVAWILVES